MRDHAVDVPVSDKHVPDSIMHVPDLKTDVPDFRSGGIRLSSAPDSAL